MLSDPAAKPRALGVIPARGGSKRLPRKNIMPVAGHPLIAHTIMAADKATALTDWLVSSDNDEIIAVAKQYGAPVPFKRPAELGGDLVRNNETVRHALDFMEQATGQPYDIVVLLQPTCPIRDPAHIDAAVRLLWESDLETLASVKGPFKKRFPFLKAIRDDVLESYVRDEVGPDVEPIYLYNASIYAAKRAYLLRVGEVMGINVKSVPLVMDRFHSADIDEAADVAVVEAYFRHLKENHRQGD